MRKKITILSAALMLLAFLAVPLGMRGQTTVASFVRNGNSNTTAGGEFTTTFSAKSGYYQDANGDCYMQILNTGAYWTTTPASISFAATIGGGSGNTDLTDPVYVSLLDANGDVISGTQTTVTSHITTNTGDNYDISIPVTNNVYGVKLSHNKQTGFNVRYYSFSLSYVEGGGSQTETHTLTFSANPAAGGTVTVGTSTSGSIDLEEEAEVNITASPAEVGYAFSNWTLNPTTTGAALDNAYNASTTFTMGEDDVELIAHFSTVTTHTVTYKANGPEAEDVVDTYNEGANVTLRGADTFTNEGYTFSEWNTLADGDGDAYSAGEVIGNIQSNIELYAIWTENTTPGGSEVVDVLNWVATGSPTNYTDWTYNAPSGAAYAGQSSGTYQSIQLRSNNNNSGIVTTASAGKVTKVTVTWNSNTVSGRTLNVYGKNSAYSAASDLYGNNAGTLIGTIVCGTSTELNITDDYEFIGVRSASGAMYLNEVDITWTSSTPAAVATPTFTPASGQEFGNDGLQVTIACTTTGASIYYTLNGDTPDNQSTLYEGAISLTETTTIKAIAYDGTNYSNVATATYTYVDPNAPGTENNPYTVAQARAAIDAGTGTQGVYATGIVSQIVTPWGQNDYQNITFNIVDEVGDEVFLQAFRCVGDLAPEVAVNDVVVVYGNLTFYSNQGIYEFAQGCQVVSLTHPTVTVEAPTFSPAAGTFESNFDLTISCATDGATIYYTTDGTEPNSGSHEYTVALNIASTTTIKAIAIKGNDVSTVATATYHINSAGNAYTVIEALNFPEYQYPANGIYVHGIVSTAPTQAPTNNGELTYFISIDGEATDQLEVYKGKGLDQAAFTSQDDIQVGDIVTIYGTVQIYNSIIEFASGNYLVDFERPAAPVVASITVDPAEVTENADEHDGTLALTYANLEISDMTDFEIQYYDAQGEETTEPDWIEVLVAGQDPEIGEGYVVSYYMIDNDGDARTAYFKVYAMDDETNLVYSNLVTINQAAYVAPVVTSGFELFTGELVEGDYVVYYDGYAMKNTVDNGRLSYETVTPENDVITTDDAAIIWHIAPSGEYWTIYSADANAYAASTGVKNKAQMLADGTDDMALWTVTGTETFEFVNKANSAAGVNANLRNNGTYGFACYATSTGGALSLYKRASEPQPSITFDLDVLELTAEEHLAEQLPFSYENFVVGNYGDFAIQFYDANNEPTAKPDWIFSASVTGMNDEGYKVTFAVISANEGEARSTYFKVYAVVNEEPVYSNLVTITQAAPVVPVELEDYAVFTGDLIEGDYLIVYDGYAMNNVVSSGRLQYAEVEAVNDVITTDSAAIIWHIAPTDGGYWTIYSADANAYAASTGAKNKAQMLEDGTDDMALWTVNGTETFEFVNKANSAAGVNANLRNNGTYGFACYSTSTGGALTLYKKVTTTATYTLDITGYGDSEKDHYYLIASPVYGLNPANVEGMTEGDFDLYYFDQTQESEWINYETETGINHFYLTPGKGYLYAHKTDTTLNFTGTPYSGNGQITLTKTEDEDAEFKGWNLIGNPFGNAATIDKAYYRLNQYGSEVNATTESSEVDRMEGVFVVAETNGETVTFTEQTNSVNNNQVSQFSINVSMNYGATIDRAIVRFDNGNQLPKFQLNPNHTKVYIPQGENDYAIVRSANEGEMPVSFKAENNGTYTFSVNAENINMMYLHLIDNMTGADVDLLAMPSYSFEARTTDYANRFRLVFSANDENGASTDSETFAFFNGSEWCISNMGAATLQVIDVTGRILSSENVNGNATISLNETPGVYVFRLVNGDNVKTQKIVVK